LGDKQIKENFLKKVHQKSDDCHEDNNQDTHNASIFSLNPHL